MNHRQEILFKTNKKMESKLFFLIFFIFIFSLTFSSNEKEEDKTRKCQPENNILDCHPEKAPDKFLDTFNFVQPKNADILENFNTKHVHSNDSALFRSKEGENIKVSSDLLKEKETKSPNVPVDLLKTHEFSCKLLDINSNVFRSICTYLSLFELELNFKCASSKIYNLYEKFLKEEKNLLTEALKNESIFLKNINCTRIYFDFFEKRFWNEPERIEYADVDSFSTNLVLFPKSIRQIVCFKYNQIEYKYVLFKNGQLSILKKVNQEGKFVFTSVENDFLNYDSPSTSDLHEKQSFKKHFIQNNVRWMDFSIERFPFDEIINPSYLTICVNSFKTNNLNQSIWHKSAHHPKLIIFETFQQFLPYQPIVFLKNITGYIKLEYDGCVTLYRFEKVIDVYSAKYTLRTYFRFKQNVTKITSKDFEHYDHEVAFFFNN